MKDKNFSLYDHVLDNGGFEEDLKKEEDNTCNEEEFEKSKIIVSNTFIESLFREISCLKNSLTKYEKEIKNKDEIISDLNLENSRIKLEFKLDKKSVDDLNIEKEDLKMFHEMKIKEKEVEVETNKAFHESALNEIEKQINLNRIKLQYIEELESKNKGYIKTIEILRESIKELEDMSQKRESDYFISYD